MNRVVKEVCPRVCDKHSTDRCGACDIDLGTCDTVWAAGDGIYCSRECGWREYLKMCNGLVTMTTLLFDVEAEEVNPQDIGIDRR